MNESASWRLTPMRRLARRWGIDYHRAFASYRADWSALRFSDGRPIQYATPVPTMIPELGVVRAPRARVLGVDGWAVVGHNRLIADASFVHESPEFQHFRYLELDAPVRLHGTTLNLASTFSNNNYGHALLDSLGRLALTDATGLDVASVDHVLIPAFWTASLERLFVASGGDPARTIKVSDRCQFVTDELIQPSFPGAPRVYPRSTAPYLRRLVAESAHADRRLLMVRRSGRRAVRNADQVIELAHKHGLELYDPMQSAFPPGDFAQAALAVSAHGADLSDIAFMPPGGTVIELLPSGNRYPYFGTLAASSGLGYAAVDCASVDDSPHSDFNVDVEELDRLLRTLD